MQEPSSLSLSRAQSHNLPRLLQTLQTNQLPIPPALHHQLMMRPTLHHNPLINHIDHIRLLDRTQPMRHRDRGSALRRRIQRRLHDLLALGVQRGGRFVEEEDLWIAQEGAGDGDALFLAAGEEGGFAADGGGEAVAAIG